MKLSLRELAEVKSQKKQASTLADLRTAIQLVFGDLNIWDQLGEISGAVLCLDW